MRRSPSTQNSGESLKVTRTKRGRLENLRPWPKGRSGNPGGRPRKTLLSYAFKDILALRVPGDRQGRTYAEKIASETARLAAKGNVTATREIADRTEGRARQAVEVTEPDRGLDLSKLSTPDLLELRRILSQLKAPTA